MSEVNGVQSAVALPNRDTETTAVASTSTAFTAKPKDKFTVSMYMANADGFGASIAQGSNHYRVSLSVDS